MSHQMAYAFERIVFFQASAADRERIHALQLLHPALTSTRTTFIHHAAELDSLEPTALLVCCGNSAAHAYRTALDHGLTCLISFEDFLTTAAQLIQLTASAAFGEVVLAFLPEALRRQASGIFSLYGFNPVAVDSSQALLRELKHGAAIVVFDQDMPSLRGRVNESREKIFSLLRAERRAHRQLAVVIIKDFDQGSLFGDMTTMAKDVSNAMLSPAEFLEYIRNYLSDFHAAHATWKLRIGHTTGLAHSTYTGRPSPCLGLADVKCGFQLMHDKAYHEYTHAREQMLIETRDLAARMAVTEWLFDKALAQEAESVGKSLAVKTEMPRLFDIQRAHAQPAQQGPQPPLADGAKAGESENPQKN
ncbi:MAG TPA: hypothetical protein PLF85_15700 [Turneriella sp.]|nr:hypothetical protein [Turneriella sp.]